MKKVIELELEFDDNFNPPNEFDEPFDMASKSKCFRCPFFESYDDYEFCCCLNFNNKEMKCPIKKFFK